MTASDVKNVERRLQAAARRRKTRAQSLEEADAELREEIRAARPALTKARIAELTGLSEPRIYQIFRHARR